MTQPIVITWPQENVGHTLATSDIFHIQNTYNGWELYIDLNKFTPIGCQAVSTNIGVYFNLYGLTINFLKGSIIRHALNCSL